MTTPINDRRTSERRAPGLSLWLRRASASDVFSIIALCAAILAALGYRRESPMSAISAVEARTTRTERRLDSLDNRLGFIAYMQCVQLRKNDPASLPPDCAPIINARVQP